MSNNLKPQLWTNRLLCSCCLSLLFDIKMAPANERPTARGSINVGSGTERLGHHHIPEELKSMSNRAVKDMKIGFWRI